MNVASDGAPLVVYHGIVWGGGVDAANGELFRIAQLQLRRGEVTVLRGANGSGKTTLLKILAFLLRPPGMRAVVAGRALSWRRARAGLRSRLVYVHQEPYLFDASVTDNVVYGLLRAGVAAKARAARVAESLAWGGLDRLAGRNAKRLSGGERQRVALARARALQPEIILLDEPVSAMDAASRARTVQLIGQLRAAGAGVVVASHEKLDGGFAVDRFLHLQDGRLSVSDGDPLAA